MYSFGVVRISFLQFFRLLRPTALRVLGTRSSPLSNLWDDCLLTRDVGGLITLLRHSAIPAQHNCPTYTMLTLQVDMYTFLLTSSLCLSWRLKYIIVKHSFLHQSPITSNKLPLDLRQWYQYILSCIRTYHLQQTAFRTQTMIPIQLSKTHFGNILFHLKHQSFPSYFVLLLYFTSGRPL